MNLVIGKITGRGPVKSAPYPNGYDIAFLDYAGTERPPDLPNDVPFYHALPMDVTVDMDRLSKNWVPFTPNVDGKQAWCELPRFTPDEGGGEEPPIEPPVGGKAYKLNLVISGTIEEI